MNRYPEAIAEIEKAVEPSQRHPFAIAFLAYAYARSGKQAETAKLLAELQSRTKTEYIPPWTFAMIYAGARNNDKAFEYLEKAREDRQAYLTHLKVDPTFDNIRDDPRFAELVKKIGIPG